MNKDKRIKIQHMSDEIDGGFYVLVRKSDITGEFRKHPPLLKLITNCGNTTQSNFAVMSIMDDEKMVAMFIKPVGRRRSVYSGFDFQYIIEACEEPSPPYKPLYILDKYSREHKLLWLDKSTVMKEPIPLEYLEYENNSLESQMNRPFTIRKDVAPGYYAYESEEQGLLYVFIIHEIDHPIAEAELAYTRYAVKTAEIEEFTNGLHELTNFASLNGIYKLNDCFVYIPDGGSYHDLRVRIKK